MVSQSASLPIVIIFERHWDKEPKKIVKSLITTLAEEGYDTLCFEAPQNLTEHEILSSHLEGLKLDSQINSQAQEYVKQAGFKNIKLCNLGFKKLAELMRQYVSSQRYLEVAEKVKVLPSSLLLKEILHNANRLSFSIKGVDIDAKDFESILSHDLSNRMSIIEEKEDYRIATISENLFKLYKQGKGLVFSGGALHAENLINKFKEQNIHNNVLYYFPHSDKNYDDSIEDVKDCLSNDTLKNHTFCLLGESNRKALVKRVIEEIKSKNIHYKEEIIGGNSHSIFLKNLFNKDFKAFMRPGYYVDALLDIEKVDDSEEIIKKLQQVNILTHKTSLFGNKYLVVRDTNTKEVADNILKAFQTCV